MIVTLDYHIHSYYSFDSLNKPIDILKVANSKGINCISITDHNSLKGSFEIFRMKNVCSDIIRIHGIELKTKSGDIIVLGLRENIKYEDICDVLDACVSNGYVSILPHPFRHLFGRGIIAEEVIKKVDLIEAYNARSSREANQKALHMSIFLNKSYTGGSDAHLLNEIGNAITYVDVKDLNEEGIIEALKKGRCKGQLIRYSHFANRIFSASIQIFKRL